MGTPKGYGKAVWRRLESVKKGMKKEEANRSPWLRLLKDIIDMFRTHKGSTTEKAEKDSENKAKK